MKIGIITHHNVHNHGANLQLFALQQVLCSFGHDPKALTYKKNYDFLEPCADIKYNMQIRSIFFYLKYLFGKGIRRTFFNINKKKKLRTFRLKNKLIGEYYSKATALDCVFIGSDEVFSLESGLNTFFWGMGVPCKNIFSYACSFGSTTIDFIKQKYSEEFIAAGIKRINKISVRDLNSQKIINQISGKKVPIIPDPVILYGFQSEIKNFKKSTTMKYLLVYAYDNNMNDKNEVDCIIAYAKSKGLITISAGFYHKWCDKNICVTPIKLLQYIWEAECVVTDTFHGAVISIIMNRPFAVKIRGNENKLQFLLEEYGLLDLVCQDFRDLSFVFGKKIDYEKINLIINEKRKTAIEYIKLCLNLC